MSESEHLYRADSILLLLQWQGSSAASLVCYFGGLFFLVSVNMIFSSL